MTLKSQVVECTVKTLLPVVGNVGGCADPSPCVHHQVPGLLYGLGQPGGLLGLLLRAVLDLQLPVGCPLLGLDPFPHLLAQLGVSLEESPLVFGPLGVRLLQDPGDLAHDSTVVFGCQSLGGFGGLRLLGTPTFGSSGSVF